MQGIRRCEKHGMHYSISYGCTGCRTAPQPYVDMEHEFEQRWNVDYWKPGHPVYEFYNDPKRDFTGSLRKLVADYNAEVEAEKAAKQKVENLPVVQAEQSTMQPSNLILLSICFTISCWMANIQICKRYNYKMPTWQKALLVSGSLIAWFFICEFIFGAK